MHMEFYADKLKQCGDQSLRTAEIGICTPLKSDIYFRFVSQTIAVIEPTVFRSLVQNLVKIGNIELMWGLIV